MTNKRGVRVSEAHHPAHCACLLEPPMLDPLLPLDGGALCHRSMAAWGNLLGRKPCNTVRVCFQNLDGISQLPEGDGTLKLQLLLQFMTTFQVDIFTVAELNTCWDLLPPDQRLPNRMKGWWENSHWSLSHNCNDSHSSIYQPSGTGIVVTNALSHCALKPGDDPLGLGHWCWVLLRGQNSHNVQIISMYCPCKADSALSTYQHHLHTLGRLKHNLCPKQAILDDLAKEITLWQEAGKTVIIAADFNDDICSNFLRRFYLQFSLSDVCSTLHGSALPATHNCGTLPIDSIFAPAALIPMCHAGYLAFSEGVLSDH